MTELSSPAAFPGTLTAERQLSEMDPPLSASRKKTTAQNAVLLFQSLMKHRYGPKWNTDVSGKAIVALAEDVAQGFGGGPGDVNSINTLPRGNRECRWRFPDGSVATSCTQGLVHEDSARFRASVTPLHPGHRSGA